MGKYEVTQAQYEAVMTGIRDGLKCHAEQLALTPNRPVEKVSWDDIQVFLTRLNDQEQAISLQGGPMYCPRKPSGSMPAVQVRPRHIHGEHTISSSDANSMGGDHGNDASSKPEMLAYTVPTPGAFLICMGM